MPGTAALEAVKVTLLLVPVLAGLKTADTPVGRSEAVRLTIPEKCFASVTVIVVLADVLAARESCVSEVDSVNPPPITWTLIVVLPDFFPERPFTST